jgi:thiosulfate/3-mercaptopyruvate sulfurtransferase
MRMKLAISSGAVMRRRAGRGLLAALMGIGACAPGLEPAPDPAAQAGALRRGMLIPAESLATMIIVDSSRARHGGAGPGLPVLLHVARSPGEYAAAHLPGARLLLLDALLTTRDGLTNELPPIAVLDSVFTAAGVTDDAPVVLYGEPLAAARAWFTLDVLGHGGHAAVLDGGMQAWRAAGLPVESGGGRDPVTRPRGSGFTPRPVARAVVDAAWVGERLGDPRFALIDARPAAEFSGDRPGEGVTRPGHIPGAQSLFWKNAIVSDSIPRLKEAAALRTMYSAAGAGAGDTVITYCRTGVQASHAYFVARYLGYDVRMYDGSYLDWIRDASRPVERGGQAPH